MRVKNKFFFCLPRSNFWTAARCRWRETKGGRSYVKWPVYRIPAARRINWENITFVIYYRANVISIVTESMRRFYCNLSNRNEKASNRKPLQRSNKIFFLRLIRRRRREVICIIHFCHVFFDVSGHETKIVARIVHGVQHRSIE